MKTWIQRTLIGLTAATLTLGGLAACGHNRWHGHGDMSQTDAQQWRAKAMARVADQLALDEAQKLKLAALADALVAQRDALRGAADRSALHAEFRGLIAGNTLDRAKAQSMLDARTLAVQVHAPQVIAAAGDFFDGLRPEQQAQVREFLDRRHQRRGG